MKKILVAIAIAACTSSAYAAISGSTHDMREKGGTKGACQYCHAPHLWTSAANMGAVAPLWNRDGNAGITARSGITVSDITRACISCHDGTTQLGDMANNPDSGLSAVVAKGVVGTDIANDHPVDKVFNTSAAGFQDPGAEYPLGAGGEIRCTTCHDVHNETAGATPFFVVDIATVDMCADCHTK